MTKSRATHIKTEATNPPNRDYIELPEDEQSDEDNETVATAAFSSKSDELYSNSQDIESIQVRFPTTNDPENPPIQCLNTSRLSCRILFLPTRTEELAVKKGGEWITVKGPGGKQTRCLAFTQNAELAMCHLQSPMNCILHFDQDNDHVLLQNKTISIHCEELLPGGKSGPKETVAPNIQKSLTPGFWRLGPKDNGVQLRIYPRQHSFVLVRRDNTSQIAGSKRLASAEPKQNPTTCTTIVRQLGSPKELESRQQGVLQVLQANEDGYSLFRMKQLHESPASVVFEAKHSAYSGKVIVVKALKSDGNLATDNTKWQIDADARIRSFYTENEGANDLARSHWCHRAHDHMFLGTPQDASRVLLDMAKALEYLNEQKVLHNDIKPANIIYKRDKGAVLIDFGLGTWAESRAKAGGSPWYIGPEFLMAERGAPSEMWALGIVMLYLLKRLPLPDRLKQPYKWSIGGIHEEKSKADKKSKADEKEPNDRSIMQMWLLLVKDTVQGLGKENHIDPPMRRIVEQMLQVDPRKRPTPAELAELATDARRVSAIKS